MLFKKKVDYHNDEIYRMYLSKHLYLIAVNKALLKFSPDKNYKDANIPFSIIDPLAEKEFLAQNIGFEHIGVNMANLNEEDYFTIYPDKDGKPSYLILSQKGFAAMTGGFFYIQAESRKRDLYQISFEETANSINFWIMIFTGVIVLTTIFGIFKECKKSPESKRQNIEIQYQNQSLPQGHTDTSPPKRVDSTPATMKTDSATPN